METFSFLGPATCTIPIGQHTVSIERIDNNVARLYFVNSGIPAGFVLLNSDKKPVPPYCASLFITWTESYELYFGSDMVLKLTPERRLQLRPI